MPNQPQDENPTMHLEYTHTTYTIYIFLHPQCQTKMTAFFSDDQEADPNSPPFGLEREGSFQKKIFFLRS